MKDIENLMEEIEYRTVQCNKLTESELTMCKELFDNHYGTWDPKANRKNTNIRFPKKNYQEYQNDPDAYVALAIISGKIIGQAFYLRKKIDGGRFVSWVLQLVVDTKYRRRGIAKTLLLSIWGFSNDYAWGLATSNAVTVMTLEKTTHRKVLPSEIIQYWNVVNQIKTHVPFASDKTTDIKGGQSIIHSDFPVDQAIIAENLKLYDGEWKLGTLSLGDEWLAFTFGTQNASFTRKEFDELFQNSRKIVIDAYSRMNLAQQSWNKGHIREVPSMLSMIPDSHSIRTAIDWGCGDGRHCHELAKKGIKVIGVDYSSRNISIAQKSQTENEQYFHGDCSSIALNTRSDLALCLYDVIGSSVKKSDNRAILLNIRRHLRRGGFLVLSVMNLEVTKQLAIHTVNRLQNRISALQKLPSSNTMQDSGAVFKPEYYLLEQATGIVYRKEQFENDGNLSAEYVIRDKRYTMNEIKCLLFLTGFQVIEARYVQAGHWDTPLQPHDIKAKEILLVARRRI